MSDPYLTASAAAHASTGIALPGTPEGDALELQADMSRTAHDLRQGGHGPESVTDTIERADALMRRAADLSRHLAPGRQSAMTGQVQRLSAARDAAVGRQAPQRGEGRPVERAPTLNPRQRLERRLSNALRRLPTNPQAAARHLSRAVHAHGGGQASVRALGRMQPADIERTMDRAGLQGAERQTVRDAVDGILGEAFHREVVRTAERAFERGVGNFERAARGRGDFERVVTDLTDGPHTYGILNSLRNAGAANETAELQSVLERTHIDPSLRQELRPAIRRTALAALRTAAASLREYQSETFGNGDLLSDHMGLAYTAFPRAIARAAQRQGVPEDRAVSIADGHASGSTLLELAAASQVRTARHDQVVAKRWAVAASVAGAVLTGGALGGGVIAAVASLGIDAPELMGAWADAESTARAASVGLSSEQAVRDAEVNRTMTATAATMGAAIEGAGLAAEIQHAVSVEEVVTGGARTAGEHLSAAFLAGSTRVPAVTNHVAHELAGH